MTIFRLYKVDGWASNYYHIEDDFYNDDPHYVGIEEIEVE